MKGPDGHHWSNDRNIDRLRLTHTGDSLYRVFFHLVLLFIELQRQRQRQGRLGLPRPRHRRHDTAAVARGAARRPERRLVVGLVHVDVGRRTRSPGNRRVFSDTSPLTQFVLFFLFDDTKLLLQSSLSLVNESGNLGMLCYLT